jgi:hypothetical protein
MGTTGSLSDLRLPGRVIGLKRRGCHQRDSLQLALEGRGLTWIFWPRRTSTPWASFWHLPQEIAR